MAEDIQANRDIATRRHGLLLALFAGAVFIWSPFYLSAGAMPEATATNRRSPRGDHAGASLMAGGTIILLEHPLAGFLAGRQANAMTAGD